MEETSQITADSLPSNVSFHTSICFRFENENSANLFRAALRTNLVTGTTFVEQTGNKVSIKIESGKNSEPGDSFSKLKESIDMLQKIFLSITRSSVQTSLVS